MHNLQQQIIQKNTRHINDKDVTSPPPSTCSNVLYATVYALFISDQPVFQSQTGIPTTPPDNISEQTNELKKILTI
ncbi:hypothetical protein Hanom_Chr07g00654491 [Helianthus anomalus]